MTLTLLTPIRWLALTLSLAHREREKSAPSPGWGRGEVRADPAAFPLEFHPSPADELFVADWLSRHGEGRPLVAMHVGAGAPVKLWGERSFVEAGDALADGAPYLNAHRQFGPIRRAWVTEDGACSCET